MEESSATEDDEEEDITEHPELADLFQPAKKDAEEEKWVNWPILNRFLGLLKTATDCTNSWCEWMIQ